MIGDGREWWLGGDFEESERVIVHNPQLALQLYSSQKGRSYALEVSCNQNEGCNKRHASSCHSVHAGGESTR